MKIVIGLMIISLISWLNVAGLLPVMPETIEDAVVKYECGNPQPCIITGRLNKSWTGRYTIKTKTSSDVFLDTHTKDLIDIDGNTYRFSDGILRFPPVMTIK